MSSASSTPDKAPQADDIRPVIATGGSGKLGLIAFTIAILIGGGWIVSLMSEQRRANDQSGPLDTRSEPASRIASPPPLAVPSDFGNRGLGEREPLASAAPQLAAAPAASTLDTPAPAPRVVVQTPPAGPAYGPREPFRPFEAPVTFSARPVPSVAQSGSQADAGTVARVNAARFEKPSRTVPQGTVIPAVLETALDSTRPGGVRALVQRDIHGFDGSRVLIPRGSRLYGEYDAELQRGQNRAPIRWTRLIRPDGVTIALDSPASDPLGRAGVRGKVDSKFFQRFGGALLQSALDIGVGVATREATDGVIVALPGSTQNVTPRLTEGEVRPTLKVRHGTSVSVFVARDLDFSSVEP
ncbi:TrbI/VirB10 family protein [Erythrobacter sp.]|uniref:TrbI/VirB10 family protein n=1 Tax=Erythrobacter sp. TaxID=1042 RepID=UPI001B1C8D40|nr:TrbI/VirB10 family protein [Erythrobacter sp.]MBO6526419.1 TrbI/VirB10 family protein [Erythrobacter sp.]MBO6530310.1 TrbI/VirB10 family protein [Erythrobacter sp.]